MQLSHILSLTLVSFDAMRLETTYVVPPPPLLDLMGIGKGCTYLVGGISNVFPVHS